MPSPCAPVPSKLRSATSFGEALFELRSRAGLTQRELARQTGFSNSEISEFENCRRAPPRQERLLALVDALNVSGSECALLFELACDGRRAIGNVRVGREIPPEVALLLRDISRVASRLTDQQIAAIRIRLMEAAM